ncbi:MAG: hypothetical protein HC888_11430 [Candidatus Competibacteraceae bacterium]|nr:hypothetical protein [Candidatus Competibacteraceae bacterium]
MNAHFEEEEFSSQFNGRTIYKIFKLALRRGHLLAGFLVMVATLSVLESLNTYIIKLIIDLGVLKSDIGAMGRYLTTYGLVMAAQAASVFGFITCAGYLGEYLQFDLRKSMFSHLQNLSFSYFDRTPVGWIMARLSSDTARIAELATWMLLDLFWGITTSYRRSASCCSSTLPPPSS